MYIFIYFTFTVDCTYSPSPQQKHIEERIEENWDGIWDAWMKHLISRFHTCLCLHFISCHVSSEFVCICNLHQLESKLQKKIENNSMFFFVVIFSLWAVILYILSLCSHRHFDCSTKLWMSTQPEESSSKTRVIFTLFFYEHI